MSQNIHTNKFPNLDIIPDFSLTTPSLPRDDFYSLLLKTIWEDELDVLK